MTAPVFSAENRLLLACSRPIAAFDLDAVLQVVACGVAWPVVLRLAGRHGISPLLYRTISDEAVEVPPYARESLRLHFKKNAARNLFLCGQLENVIGTLESAGIRALALKGPVLSALAYGDLGLRECWDLDVLIAPADVRQAITVLAAEGYRVGAGGVSPQSGDIELTLGGPCLVDLHWHLTPKYLPQIDSPAIWDRARRLRVLRREVYTLSSEDLLIFLSIRSAGDCWVMLRAICDIAHLISHEPIDWDYVSGNAERAGAKRIVAVNMLLACNLLGAPIPQGIFRFDHQIRKVADRAAEATISDTPGPASMFREGVTHLRLLPPQRRVYYLLQRAFVPTTTDAAGRSNSSWAITRSIVRPARLMLKSAEAIRTAASRRFGL